MGRRGEREKEGGGEGEGEEIEIERERERIEKRNNYELIIRNSCTGFLDLITSLPL